MGLGARWVLVTLVVAELLLALYLWIPRSRAPRVEQPGAPEIEERHFIALIVRDPGGRVVERVYETRSFVYPFVLFYRAFTFWYWTGSEYRSRFNYQANVYGLNASGYPQEGGVGPGQFPSDRPEFGFAASLVFLGSGASGDGGKHLGNPIGASAQPSVSYAYNDLWFNVTVTATFSFSRDTTVSEAMLAAVDESLYPYSPYFPIVYDSFQAVTVPAGGSLTVQWTFAWKDYGAFTENWGRLWQYALTLNVAYGGPRPNVTFVDSSGVSVAIPWPNSGSAPERMVSVDLAWGSGTAPMSRSSYRLQSETGSAQASVSFAGTGFSLGGSVGAPSAEVGLYWLAYDASGNLHRILLMRWVPGSTLPAGTPINVYVARGG
jgi:hypothetical protein